VQIKAKYSKTIKEELVKTDKKKRNFTLAGENGALKENQFGDLLGT
jgi:hypothetical protein